MKMQVFLWYNDHMKIITLVENTVGPVGCPAEHGLSLYIETERHKILMDTGASDLLVRNAGQLDVDLAAIDTVVISHGHYDHGGGLPTFMRANRKAAIYIQLSATGNFYAVDGEDNPPRFIGLTDEVTGSDRITWLSGSHRIDDELNILSNIGLAHPTPEDNNRLRVCTGLDADDNVSEKNLLRDDFRHEQCLVINDSILLSGCAHHGILNVMDRFREAYGRDPDVVISGFHMMRKDGNYSEADTEQIRRTAQALKTAKTIFYTGHCTGEKPYEIMHAVMGDQLRRIRCGDILVDTAPE